jgi:hypothetical protein
VAKPYLISAIGTPLEDDECLHGEGLRAHLEQQRAANIDGILVAGTMGLLQMLRDQTYQQLVESLRDCGARTVSFWWESATQVLPGREIDSRASVVCLVTGSAFKDPPSLERMNQGIEVPALDVDQLETML